MSQHGKKYTDAAKQVDRESLQTVPAAIEQVKELPPIPNSYPSLGVER